ncbi:MAG: hypothetical protein OXG23_02715 [Chloroflexi bacterium]|nr:hypothetical protein [Chloroflexota bacterium]
MKTNAGERVLPWQLFTAINFLLLAAAVGLGFVALIYSLEIALALGARLIWQSLGDTVQAKYALVTLRNLWLLVGGILLLVVTIYCINYFFKRWQDARIHRLNLFALAVEALVIIAAQVLITA